MSFQGFQQYLWKHRGKVALAAAAVVATGVFISTTTWSNTENNNKEKQTNQIAPPIDESKLEQSMRKKLLLIRQQLETSSSQILPTLRLKITQVVDVLQTIKLIKELRLNNKNTSITTNTTTDMNENELWEEIKVLSFTLWFVSIYLTCAISILLRIQLFLLAKSDHINLNIDQLNNIISRTYTHIFDYGIQHITDLTRAYVTKQLIDWTVRENTSVTYEELNGFVYKVRHYIEVECKDLITTLIIGKLSYTYNIIYNVLVYVY